MGGKKASAATRMYKRRNISEDSTLPLEPGPWVAFLLEGDTDTIGGPLLQIKVVCLT